MRFLNPQIGIWWDNGEKTVALTHDASVNSTGSRLIDSNLSHAESWPSVCHQLGMTANDEYFIIPRGRVLYRPFDGHGLIYHGRGTSPRRLKAIAETFNLAAWESRPDDHYAVGEDTDLIFEQD